MRKLQNRGFSLIEVLVAVAILALISLPILKAFTQAATINSKARQEENANTAASAVAENFKSLSLEQLKEKYKNEYTLENGVYTFNITNTDYDYYLGVNGEEFQVQVLLDPGAYTDGTAEDEKENNPKNNINSFDMPQFTSLNSSENIVLRNEIYQWDTDAKGTFCIQSGESNMNIVAAGIKRKVDITASVELISEDAAGGHFVQKVEGNVTYSYAGCPDYVRTFDKEWEFVVQLNEDNKYVVSRKTGLKRIYLFYTAYDIYTNTEVTDLDDASVVVADACYASDRLNIDYVYDNSPQIQYEDLDMYVVQQDITTAENDNKVYLNRQNVTVQVCGKDIDMTHNGTIDLSDISGIKGPVDIYSNIYGWDRYKASQTDRNNGITVNGNKSEDGYLYTMTVNVWLDKESKDAGKEAIATVVSTKEN